MRHRKVNLIWRNTQLVVEPTEKFALLPPNPRRVTEPEPEWKTYEDETLVYCLLVRDLGLNWSFPTANYNFKC